MKYKAIKDNPWCNIGEELETDINGYFNLREHKTKEDGDTRLIVDIHISLSDYPDFFEPISEEDEKLEEAKKLLENNGYRVFTRVESQIKIDMESTKCNFCGNILPKNWNCACRFK